MKIFIYGPPGTGKTTIGNALAQSLGFQFWDLDSAIEKSSQKSIEAIFISSGEAGFRAIESQVLTSMINNDFSVYSLGGGALLNSDNRKIVEGAGVVISLRASLDTMVSRLQSSETQRPLLADIETNKAYRKVDRNKLEQLLLQRAQHYDSFSHQLRTDGRTIDELVIDAMRATGIIQASGIGLPYNIVVQSGIIREIGAWLNQLNASGPVPIVSDRNVDSLGKHGYSAARITIDPGEEYKSLGTVQKVWNEFLKLGIERSNVAIALGGGVVSDLAGFAAAVYMRGIDWIDVPTSLLAMVDASVGGKTSIDLPQGKNLVGSFHSPRLVIIDPQVLRTLPEAEFRNGLAEVIKTGIIGDLELFEICAQGLGNVFARIDEVILRSISVKASIVSQDPFEKGKRASLNLGHTIGHAIERASGYSIRHGEAVAMGIAVVTQYSEKHGLINSKTSQRIIEVIQRLGLPVSIPPTLSKEILTQYMEMDKKKKNKKIRFVLPVRIGEVIWDVEADPWTLF
jgi:3-dehydroquinate synthase